MGFVAFETYALGSFTFTEEMLAFLKQKYNKKSIYKTFDNALSIIKGRQCLPFMSLSDLVPDDIEVIPSI